MSILEPLAPYATGIEIGLVILVFGHAIMTHTFVGVVVLFIMSQTVLLSMHRTDEEAAGT